MFNFQVAGQVNAENKPRKRRLRTRGKEKCQESKKPPVLLDESLKDEIRLLHGSVFDLYLDSLNIREAEYQGPA